MEHLDTCASQESNSQEKKIKEQIGKKLVENIEKEIRKKIAKNLGKTWNNYSNKIGRH